MKIAQIAPLYESVPPKLYGGTERVVAYLTEALVELGHDITLYASGDSKSRARLRAGCDSALRLKPGLSDPIADHILLIERVFQDSEEFELVHSHLDYMPFPMLRRMSVPHLTTLHGRLDTPNLLNVFREFKDEPLVSISDAQRTPLAFCNWQRTVHHGLPADLYEYRPGPGKFLAFLGRVSPEKGLPQALEIAAQAGLPLKIAAKVDKVDKEYFEAQIEPMLSRSGVEFIGEIGEHEKNDFLGSAVALLFPIHWPEPFGMVLIESMACGTPIIAYPCGSVPEVVDDGVSGLIVNDVPGAVEALKKIAKLDRKLCRKKFEERFTATTMAQNYLSIYRRLVLEPGAARKRSIAV